MTLSKFHKQNFMRITTKKDMTFLKTPRLIESTLLHAFDNCLS